MVRQAKQSIAQEKTWEGSPNEFLDGIHLVGEEAPAFSGDPLLRSALGEELRRIQARATKGDNMARRYVGSWRKVLG
ncbi:MAG: hypothetical protein K8R69_01135 [Deltaproteobacteria bacterium]|nr:hypothetical protein [Deltaproteobacteria bacterium]